MNGSLFSLTRVRHISTKVLWCRTSFIFDDLHASINHDYVPQAFERIPTSQPVEPPHAQAPSSLPKPSPLGGAKHAMYTGTDPPTLDLRAFSLNRAQGPSKAPSRLLLHRVTTSRPLSPPPPQSQSCVSCQRWRPRTRTCLQCWSGKSCVKRRACARARARRKLCAVRARSAVGWSWPRIGPRQRQHWHGRHSLLAPRGRGRPCARRSMPPLCWSMALRVNLRRTVPAHTLAKRVDLPIRRRISCILGLSLP